MVITAGSLLGLIIFLIFLVVICLGAKWFIDYMGVPQPINWLVTLLVGLVCLVAFLAQVGIIGGGPLVKLGG